MRLIFDCYNYLKGKNVKLVAYEFTNYAIMWQEQLVLNHERNPKKSVKTWEEKRTIMRK